MKRVLVALCVFLLGVNAIPCWSMAPAEMGIAWLTNYEEAVKQSRNQSKPMLVFFTGTGWCPACSKLEQEVFDTQSFAELAADKYIFLKLDFPQDKSLIDGQTAAQNKHLLKKFDVRSFPTVLLLEPKNQVEIGITGYRPGGPRQYASHLSRMVADFSTYNQKMQKLDGQHLSGLELKALYEKAKELDLMNDVQTLLKTGVSSDQKDYFLLERYRWLAEEGMMNEKEAVAIRQQLLAFDPENVHKTQYELAVIDFEAYANEKDQWPPEKVAAPLMAYVEKYGQQDKENLWRLNIIISQVYLNKKKYPEAIKYAQSSYQNAPEALKPDIKLAIVSMEEQVNKR